MSPDRPAHTGHDSRVLSSNTFTGSPLPTSGTWHPRSSLPTSNLPKHLPSEVVLLQVPTPRSPSNSGGTVPGFELTAQTICLGHKGTSDCLLLLRTAALSPRWLCRGGCSLTGWERKSRLLRGTTPLGPSSRLILLKHKPFMSFTKLFSGSPVPMTRTWKLLRMLCCLLTSLSSLPHSPHHSLRGPPAPPLSLGRAVPWSAQPPSLFCP